ncbi:MAG: glycoside hydrolase family 32 protein [bacterium]
MYTILKRLATILMPLVVAMNIASDEASANSSIDKAMQGVRSAVRKAEADPTRPICHFHPPSQWMNDPNGTIYHKGFYHVFYQHNPYDDEWGHMHWGHTRSKDLVHWEYLPIALWPSEEKGEEHCFSGCARINGSGEPMIFYTMVPPRSDKCVHQQWAALGDDDLVFWKKHPANPILDLDTQGGPRFGDSWRDPFIFEEAGHTFMVLGADLGEEAVIPIYESEDPDLSRWQYRGILFRLPKEDLKFFECPNFFKLDGKWILFCSPYRPVEYFIGSFDLGTYTFSPETRGILDHGRGRSANFYASNILFDNRDRCVLFGWVRGFEKGRGWNGCLALPRILSIGPDGHPRQTPVPELESLRGKHVQVSDLELKDGERALDHVKSDALEITATFDLGNAKACGMKVLRAGNECAAEIRYDSRSLVVAETEVPLELKEGENILDLHIFIDRSVMEVFADKGRISVTRIIDPGQRGMSIECFAESGEARVKSLEVWELASIW